MTSVSPDDVILLLPSAHLLYCWSQETLINYKRHHIVLRQALVRFYISICVCVCVCVCAVSVRLKTSIPFHYTIPKMTNKYLRLSKRAENENLKTLSWLRVDLVLYLRYINVGFCVCLPQLHPQELTLWQARCCTSCNYDPAELMQERGRYSDEETLDPTLYVQRYHFSQHLCQYYHLSSDAQIDMPLQTYLSTMCLFQIKLLGSCCHRPSV